MMSKVRQLLPYDRFEELEFALKKINIINHHKPGILVANMDIDDMDIQTTQTILELSIYVTSKL